MNVMDQHVYDAMPQKLLLQPRPVKVSAYGNPGSLTMCDVFSAHVVLKDRPVTSPTSMVTIGKDTLVSYTPASALGLIQMIHMPQPNRLNQLLPV